MTLSDKFRYDRHGEKTYEEEDVKQFIKELKENINDKKHLLDYKERMFYLELIDKLAGDKLI